MQTPERLALIGGSILLSSLLVFTLKSQVSKILPKVSQPISNIQGTNEDLNAQHGNEFDKQWYQAKQSGQEAGDWGTAKFYIDSDQNMYVGDGQLQGLLKDAVGNDTSQVKTLTFQGHVQAPHNSFELFREMSNVIHINNMDHVDVSNVTNTGWMFHEDFHLQSLDLSSWHLKNTFMPSMFAEDMSLQSLNISNFDTSSGWNDGMFFTHNNSLSQLTLGDKTSLVHSGIDGTWQNGSQVLNSNQMNANDKNMGQLNSDHPLPGTWVRQ